MSMRVGYVCDIKDPAFSRLLKIRVLLEGASMWALARIPAAVIIGINDADKRIAETSALTYGSSSHENHSRGETARYQMVLAVLASL